MEQLQLPIILTKKKNLPIIFMGYIINLVRII